jgi:adenylate cyclase
MVAITTITVFFFGAWGSLETGETLSLSWQDFLYSTRVKTGEDIRDVVIVAVDEPSFRALNQKWPWPRTMHATVVEKLSRTGPKAIVFDILFSEPSRNPEDDQVFATAIQAAGNVSLGKFISHTQRDTYTQSIVVEPISILKEAAATTGFVNHFPDNDGIVRFAYKYLESSFSLAYSGCRAAGGMELGCRACEDNVFLIDFKPESADIPVVSFYQVLQDLVDPSIFKDRYVFVGLGSDVKVDAQGAVDAFPTPFFRFEKKMMYGVEIHANALITLITGCRLNRLDHLLIQVLFLGIAVLPFWVRTKPLVLTAAGTVGFLGLAGFSMVIFNTQALVIDIVPAALTLAVNTLVLGLNEFRKTHKERRYIKHAFESYVAADIVKSILDDPGALALGGEDRELTVMFTDINGFTTISESLEPEELVSVLNDYLEFITQVILENKGTLDKYIGDAVMAFFGAPVFFDDHARKACDTAQALDTRMNQPEQTSETVFSGITMGINTGHMIVGNVGSEKRFDYTVIGDTVNLASRLEGLNKTYGTTIIIGENTRVQLSDQDFLIRELDYVKVKGKHQAISIYELMANTPENSERIAGPFARGLAAYRAKEWQAALDIFNSILAQCPADGPSKVFIERCRYFSQNPLPDDWDMVWEMTIK